MPTDAQRLDWLEKRGKKSPTGISFDWIPSVDGEPSGYRYMHRHFIGGAEVTLRGAIDHAMRMHPEGLDVHDLEKVAGISYDVERAFLEKLVADYTIVPKDKP